MTEEDLIAFLEKNLSIEINQNTEFGPVETIEVGLYLKNKNIASSYCQLP